MRRNLVLPILLLCIFSLSVNAQNDSIVISGIVSDFEGNPADSAFVELKGKNFGRESKYETHTDNNGRYFLRVKKGRYLALASMKMCEYPKSNTQLAPEDQRLEFWAWNVIADVDQEINIHYHRLEVYGLNVFRIEGATPGYTIYCRPMSLSKYYANPDKPVSETDICTDPDQLKVEVEINGVPTKVNMKQKVKEYVSSGICNGYLLHVNLPKNKSSKPYDIFRVVMTDLENGDKGEAMYYLEKKQYE